MFWVPQLWRCQSEIHGSKVIPAGHPHAVLTTSIPFRLSPRAPRALFSCPRNYSAVTMEVRTGSGETRRMQDLDARTPFSSVGGLVHADGSGGGGTGGHAGWLTDFDVLDEGGAGDGEVNCVRIYFKYTKRCVFVFCWQTMPTPSGATSA